MVSYTSVARILFGLKLVKLVQSPLPQGFDELVFGGIVLRVGCVFKRSLVLLPQLLQGRVPIDLHFEFHALRGEGE